MSDKKQEDPKEIARRFARNNRPTEIIFETEEEYDEFMEWAFGGKENNSEGIQRARKLLKETQEFSAKQEEKDQ